MERIDLNTKVYSWLDHAYAIYGALIAKSTKGHRDVYRRDGATLDNLRLLLKWVLPCDIRATVGDLCRISLYDFFAYDLNDVCILSYLLGKYGLRIEMTKDELFEYECAYKDDKVLTAINWEQRRWDLATQFALQIGLRIHTPAQGVLIGETKERLSFKDAIAYADAFIGEYKSSLIQENKPNKEE